MARRSSGVVDAGTSGYPPGGFSAADPWDPPVQKRRRERRRWGGSGGRWWIYVGRVILWAFLIVVLVNGVRAPFERFMAKPVPADKSGSGQPRFPSAAASSYALAFTNVYLNYDQATAPDRQRRLGQFLAPEVDPQLGWDGGGRSVLQSAQVSSVDSDDANHAIVTVLVRANDKAFQLAVPVYAKGGAMAISGRPAILAPPPKASVPALGQDRDSELESGLAEPLAGFFKAYAGSDVAALQRYSDPPVTGLGGAVTFGQVKEIIAPPGGPDSRTVNATVVWQVPPAQPKTSGGMLEQTYRLTMVKKDGNWYVTSIRGSTLPAES
jgi:Conjugative transposon protein TcpC